MPQLGPNVTGMSAPDTRGASFIGQGFDTRHGGMGVALDTALIQTAAGVAKEAYAGYQMAGVQDETQGLIDQYASTSPTVFTKAMQGAPESVWAGATPANPVEKQFTDTLNKYTNAVKQGVMSPDEFSTRSLATLRNAVNKNPALYDDLVRHTQKVMELSGIQSVIKADELFYKSSQQQQDEYLKDLRTRAKEQDVSYTATTPIWELEQQVADAEKDSRNFKVFQRGKDYTAYRTTQEAQSWVTQNGDSAVRGGLANFGKTILALGEAAQADPSQFAKIKAQVTAQAEVAKETFISGIPTALRNDPMVQQKIDSYTKGIDSLMSSLNNLGSGDDWKKAVANHLQVTKDMQSQTIVDHYDLASIDLVQKMMQADPGMLVMSQTTRNAVRDTGLALSTGNFKAPVITNYLPKNLQDGMLSDHIGRAAKVARDNRDYSGLDKILNTFNSTTTVIANPTQRDLFQYKNLDAIAKTDLAGAPSTTIGAVNNMIGQYLHDPQYGIPSLLANLKKYGAKMDVTPDGRTIFTGPNAQAFNEKYGIRINTSLEAYARVNNISVKEASKKFYKDYFGGYYGPNK